MNKTLASAVYPDVPLPQPVDNRAARGATRYAPSWFDRLKVGVDQLPGPAWLFYLGAAIALYGLRTILQWGAGTYAVGTFEPSLLFTSLWPWYGLGAMHYLDRAAGQAFDGLRPILSGTAATQRALRYQLTTMPAGAARAASLGALLIGASAWLLTSRDPILGQELAQHIARVYGPGTSPLVLGLTLLAVWIVGGLFFYHTIRHMRLIRTITTHHTNVAGLQLTPLYRLSRVMAATAAAWSGGLTLGILTILTIPQLLSDPVALVLTLGVIALAFVTFVWPLLGIHGVLETEKIRLHLDARERMNAALSELKRRQDRADYTSMGAMNEALDALLKQEAVVDKMSTWPWRSGTMGALATALFLPLVIWLITRVLAQVIP